MGSVRVNAALACAIAAMGASPAMAGDVVVMRRVIGPPQAAAVTYAWTPTTTGGDVCLIDYDRTRTTTTYSCKGSDGRQAADSSCKGTRPATSSTYSSTRCTPTATCDTGALVNKSQRTPTAAASLGTLPSSAAGLARCAEVAVANHRTGVCSRDGSGQWTWWSVEPSGVDIVDASGWTSWICRSPA